MTDTYLDSQKTVIQLKYSACNISYYTRWIKQIYTRVFESASEIWFSRNFAKLTFLGLLGSTFAFSSCKICEDRLWLITCNLWHNMNLCCFRNLRRLARTGRLRSFSRCCRSMFLLVPLSCHWNWASVRLTDIWQRIITFYQTFDRFNVWFFKYKQSLLLVLASSWLLKLSCEASYFEERRKPASGRQSSQNILCSATTVNLKARIVAKLSNLDSS